LSNLGTSQIKVSAMMNYTAVILYIFST